MLSNFDKRIVGKNFSRGAKNYEESALIQKQAAQKLCNLASPFIKTNSKILDLGSGTGFVAECLNRSIFETDLSLEMLQKNTSPTTLKTQCDFENLPFKNHSLDILISSFSMQWLSDFEKSFTQFAALLKPRGILAFCLPTDGSLKELRTASLNSGCDFNFNVLPKISYLKLALKNCGFEEKLFESEIVKSEFVSGLDALKSIKEIGANYAVAKKFISKTQLSQFDSFCLKNFTNDRKKISISWNTSFFIFQNPS